MKCENCRIRTNKEDLCGDGYCRECHRSVSFEDCVSGAWVEVQRQNAGLPIVPRLPNRHEEMPLEVVKSDLYPHFAADGSISHVCWRLTHTHGVARVVQGRAASVAAAYVAIQTVINEWFPPEAVKGSALVIRPIVDSAEHDEVGG